ncbi:BnaC04g24150D [Brassica napus]|uniref:Uncharacterized protein n=2 Tax=Brassica TaxID=3705 RepID=A0A3P6C5M0_BRAOL|nr:uncharacterized protein BNAC04G24150D [Brassica napus]CAF1849265.1 unnamed protein product [Brassica napus]CDY31009.1 BnaC04g24150D [Brassica napus]VDD09598.1 unnamed protein product [Brassica oleracea]
MFGVTTRLDAQMGTTTTPTTIYVDPPPQAQPSHSSEHRSIETLVVVLAVITILSVLASIFARLCGGRHLSNAGDHDIECWVERKSRSCIDAGAPTVAAPPPPAAATVEEQSKK